MDDKLAQQSKLDRNYKRIITAMVVVVSLAIIAIFIQIYSINNTINAEVQQVQAAQKKNRSINDAQNSIILGYLTCIGNIDPHDRTPQIVQSCVDKAKQTDITK